MTGFGRLEPVARTAVAHRRVSTRGSQPWVALCGSPLTRYHIISSPINSE